MIQMGRKMIMNNDTVYLYWNNRRSNKSYKVAKLYKENGKFYFKYIVENVRVALKDGFMYLIPFPNVNATYESNDLFACFATRLPDKRRPEIRKILDTYGLKEYDEYELLKASGAKLPTDEYEFRRD